MASNPLVFGRVPLPNLPVLKPYSVPYSPSFFGHDRSLIPLLILGDFVIPSSSAEARGVLP